VEVCDISAERVARAKELYGIGGKVADGKSLPYEDGEFDTVVLGEVLEHVDNPGLLFGEAARVASERVVISVPLNGWADPTHIWRISVDVLGTQNPNEPTKGQQAVLTWQKGRAWPQDYFRHDPKWREQFWLEPTTEFHINVVDE
jgi:ubiquinone/menaquinone biosynthesis C-methylase UbiE